MFLTYVALIYKTKKAGKYGVTFPDFPGCVSAGNTINDAVRNGRNGLIFHMEGMLEDKEKLPKPTSLEKIILSPESKSAIFCFINIIPPTGRLKRINISIDTGLLAEIDHAAKLCGKNRSEFLAEAAQQVLA